jgi:hypothetical protein
VKCRQAVGNTAEGQASARRVDRASGGLALSVRLTAHRSGVIWGMLDVRDVMTIRIRPAGHAAAGMLSGSLKPLGEAAPGKCTLRIPTRRSGNSSPA